MAPLQVFYCIVLYCIVPRGHGGHQQVKILGKSDEGIFRGESGKNFFSTPYIFLKGVMGPPNFSTH